MQKSVSYQDILTVQMQAFRDGKQVGGNHLMMAVRLEDPAHVENYARLRAEDTWKRIQLGLRAIHTAWTGHRPQFYDTYITSFLLGYSQANPKAYVTYLFPEYNPAPHRSSKAQRKYLQRQQRTQQHSARKAA